MLSGRTLHDAGLRERYILYVNSVVMDGTLLRYTPDDSGRITETCNCFRAMRLLLSAWKVGLSGLDKPRCDRMDRGARIDSGGLKETPFKIDDSRAKR